MSGHMTVGPGVDPDRSGDQSITIDRRSALKKAAVAAGVGAWTTPLVQVVSPGTAHAQTVTGCSPVITITLRSTGPDCDCVPGGVSPSCCNDNTYFVQSLDVECGPTCAGPAVRVGPFEFPGLVPAPAECPDEIAEFPCQAARATFRTTFPVRCPDGETYLFDATVTAVCQPCPPVELDSPPPIAPEDPVFSNEVTTSTTEAQAPSTSAAPTTTTTEPDAEMPPSTSAAPTTTTTEPDAEVPPSP